MWGFCSTTVDKILKNFEQIFKEQISAKFLKDGAPVIAIHLVNINLSIKLDTFLSQCKIAKIKPLFKKGIKTEAKNYRPISILPLTSKSSQFHIKVHNQTYYLQRNELLYIYQSSGFRANHSTYTCLSRFTDMILSVAENWKHPGMILINFQKAFDIFDHKISLFKLNCIGFSTKTIKWFHSYPQKELFSFHWTMCFPKQGL